MAMDGDTSFDNDMAANAVGHFLDPAVVGVAGSLRVRNVAATLWTRLQAIEYALSIQSAKAGLSEFNVVNNISGAFGIFRIDLSQAFLQGCAALERTLPERKDKRLLLEADRQEFLTAFEMTSRTVATARASETFGRDHQPAVTLRAAGGLQGRTATDPRALSGRARAQSGGAG